jgi:hypothetical protein
MPQNATGFSRLKGEPEATVPQNTAADRGKGE